MRLLTLVGASALLTALPMAAQEPLRLDLTEAMERARRSHPSLATIREQVNLRTADKLGAAASYLPTVAAEWSWIRSNDPVTVFGSRLRQGTFSSEHLALDALNTPGAVSNASLGVTIEQPLVAPSGWAGRQAASAGVKAAIHMQSRAEQLAAMDALTAYYAAALSEARLAALDAALLAGHETLRQVRALRKEGVVTLVDEQLAIARVSELEAAKAMAISGRQESSDRLLVLIGEHPGRTVELLDSLAMAKDVPTRGERADLEALREAITAQEANLRRARSELLPTVGVFGNMALNDRSLTAINGPNRWTAGVVVRWSPFRGMRESAEIDRASASRNRAQEELAAAERSAEAEVMAAEARLEAATTALAAADRALEHARQAARIADTRYAGGAGTISELLAIRASESNQRLARLDALFQARLAQAHLAIAKGTNP